MSMSSLISSSIVLISRPNGLIMSKSSLILLTFELIMSKSSLTFGLEVFVLSLATLNHIHILRDGAFQVTNCHSVSTDRVHLGNCGFQIGPQGVLACARSKPAS